MKKSRIFCWVLCLIIAFVFFNAESWLAKITLEKANLYVYAPKEMKDAFDRSLILAKLNKNYQIVMTDDTSKANIMVELGKEFDPEYTKIAYSPFVVAYSWEGDTKGMVKKGILQDAFFNKGYQEIVFSKVIEEVLSEGKWENLGVKDMGNVKVYYPAPDTKYYVDYYDFMLVTVNGGVYPENESDLQKAIEQIKLFENSDYTEAVNDFKEKFNRTGGFMENSLFLIPEQEVYMLTRSGGKYGTLFYPTTTIYVNYYIRADELGNKLVVVFKEPDTFYGNFYDYIAKNVYRSDWKNVLGEYSNVLKGERDIYNILHIEKDRIKPEEL